jgi:hypothetical protein
MRSNSSACSRISASNVAAVSQDSTAGLQEFPLFPCAEQACRMRGHDSSNVAVARIPRIYARARSNGSKWRIWVLNTQEGDTTPRRIVDIELGLPLLEQYGEHAFLGKSRKR